VNTTTDGLAPKITNSNGIITPNDKLLIATTDNNPGWYQLPITAFSDTYRPILIGD
jgi:hypothetical protein